MKYLLPALVLLSIANNSEAQSSGKWISLFNGKNLDGWVVKISGYEAGDNFANTYRVKNGAIETGYEGYGDSFNNRFGLLFYKTPFSYYRLKLKYRFFGEQAPGIASWAWRNSGVMIHSQSPESMPRDQDFPISLEVQFLGGDGKNERPTGNLCTPGTHVEIDGKLVEDHCIQANAKTYHGNRWVKAEVLVLGDSLIQHIFGGKPVISYSKPVIGGTVVDKYDPMVKVDGTPLRNGYIALQSESHPIAFKSIKIKTLDQSGNPIKVRK
jgi:hypothetical protein